MAKTPAVVIIARHGARLDAADKTWHLSSPTPYDPPLTYGGWIQSRALGLRIASLLHAREEELENQDIENGTAKGLGILQESKLDWASELKENQPGNAHKSRSRRRKYRVVIHTSPFLRCVQTSVAISAGLAQFRDSHQRHHVQSSASRPRLGSFRTSPHIHKADDSILRSIDQYSQGGRPSESKNKEVAPRIRKSTLRVDAFLGEWLSPEYFENITPPPNSTMMVASAKADLLRSGEQIQTVKDVAATKGNFPGGWTKGNFPATSAEKSSVVEEEEGGPLADWSSLQHLMHKPHHRSSSQSDAGNRHAVAVALRAERSAYIPPVPAYAVSPADPIPTGYVKHAQDACVDVDYQWDSMREPQLWGDGGEYGEEWSAMHKRFRRGINGMILWYKSHEVDPVPQNAENDASNAVTEDEDDEDTDLVAVLVTHGAGCNALIGALTSQPVLLDVGMASLTMAVKKDTTVPSNGLSTSPTRRRSSAIDMKLAEEYELQLTASNEHLRGGTDPTSLAGIASPKIVAKIPEYRRRYNSVTSKAPALDGLLTIGEPARPVNSSLGSMRRGSSSNNSLKSFNSDNASRNSTSGSTAGLWTRPSATPSTLDGLSDEGGSPKHVSFQFPTESPKQPPKQRVAPDNAGLAPAPPNFGRSLSQHGLWGSGPTGDRTERERGPKRRWTVAEKDAQI